MSAKTTGPATLEQLEAEYDDSFEKQREASLEVIVRCIFHACRLFTEDAALCAHAANGRGESLDAYMDRYFLETVASGEDGARGRRLSTRLQEMADMSMFGPSDDNNIDLDTMLYIVARAVNTCVHAVGGGGAKPKAFRVDCCNCVDMLLVQRALFSCVPTIVVSFANRGRPLQLVSDAHRWPSEESINVHVALSQ